MPPTREQIVRTAIERHGRSREALLPVLQEVISQKKRFLSDRKLYEVARQMGIPEADVYGTASFYSFLDIEPRGRHVIRVCKSISCYMAGKDELIAAISGKLKIELGDTTPDRRFSFLPVNCLGMCHRGPAMLVDDDIYTEVTAQQALEILDTYA